MDQDSFRRMILTPGSSGSGSRGNVSTKSKTVDAAQPVFKPRKLKKADAESKYRDRAAERRQGGGNDYAHVEAVLRDFEQRNATNDDRKAIEEQRKYLGGDSEHSILVKGLDMALLEQNRARAALDSTEDDDTLEEAYLEATALPKKRTREDLIKELKKARTQTGGKTPEGGPEAEAKQTAQEEAKALEEAKKQGKFKPLGFKPIAAPEQKEKKKKKVKTEERAAKENRERKKKRKIEGPEIDQTQDETEAKSTQEILTTTPTAPTQQLIQSGPNLNPEPEARDDDFDIFAGAGDYDGIDLGDDDEDEDDEAEPEPAADHTGTSHGPSSPSRRPRKWILTEEDGKTPVESRNKPQSPSPNHESSAQKPDSHDTEMEDGETREHEEQQIRLQPLESSNLPSIRDFLAMDEAAEAAEKRRKRKEKKKAAGGGGGSKNLEQKVNRDFQRLQSYTNKKEASGSK